MANSLERSFKTKPDPGAVDVAAPIALLDANHEAIRFMSDVAHEIEYAPYAASGMKIQTFLKLRMLVFMDEYEDIKDEARIAKLGLDTLDEFRAMPEYEKMKQQFRDATTRLATETATEWISRAGRRARNNLERLSRTSSPELMRDAPRAAGEIVGREIPQIGREPKSNNNLLVIPDSLARSLAAAFQERQIKPVEIPPVDVEEVK